MQKSMIKTMLISVITSVEKQMDQQTAVLKELRDQFIVKLAESRGIVYNDDSSFDIDLPNKLCIFKKEKNN